MLVAKQVADLVTFCRALIGVAMGIYPPLDPGFLVLWCTALFLYALPGSRLCLVHMDCDPVRTQCWYLDDHLDSDRHYRYLAIVPQTDCP